MRAVAAGEKPVYETGAAGPSAQQRSGGTIARAGVDLDAMGKDKRRKVMGGTYGPTRARIFATFAITFAVIAVVVIGFYLAAKEMDQPPEANPSVAPWSAPDAPQHPTRDIQ